MNDACGNENRSIGRQQRMAIAGKDRHTGRNRLRLLSSPKRGHDPVRGGYCGLRSRLVRGDHDLLAWF